MANVLTSVRTHAAADDTIVPARRPPLQRLQNFQSELLDAAATPKTAAAEHKTATTTAPAAEPAKAESAAPPDWRALFSGKVYPVTAESPAQPPVPSAESVFGPNPWLSNPTGSGPAGQYSYNPFYFASRETALKVAQMAGGTVVESNMFTPNGGVFAQSQPNYMVRLADGRMINPGLVASFYTHGYSQSYVDQMVAAEIRNA